MRRILIIIGVAILSCAILSWTLVSCERIDAGHVGLKVNMVGGDKGISQTEYVTGWVVYSPLTSRVEEFPTFQQHDELEPFDVPSKGGTIFTVHPSYNYNINSGHVAEMYGKFRLGVKQLEEGYLKNAVIIAVREVTNTFTVDSILNNLITYDAAVVTKVNKSLSPFFVMTQFTSNLTPDDKLKDAISAKSQTLQEAIKIENQQKTIQAQAENDIISARRDSAVQVIQAQGEANAIRLKQQAITPGYIDLIRAEKWDGKYPTTMLGSGSGTLLNIGLK